VKSRLTRGRQMLKERLAPYVREVAAELGLTAPDEEQEDKKQSLGMRVAVGDTNVEVTP
jgi:hypothetical protein